MDIRPGDRTAFPHQQTRAAKMLRHALDVAQRERRMSIRKLGAELGYKQATVLSHMASGRVPIPLERAPDIARATGIDPAKFLVAAVEQRNSQAPELLAPAQDNVSSFSLVRDLSLISGAPLDELTDEQKLVMREAASDPRASRRWLSVAELPLVDLVRRLRPAVVREGLTSVELARIAEVLK